MITTRYYKLNKSLDSFADYSIFRRAGFEPKNKIENLRSEIIHYKKRINQASKKHISELQELLKKDQENYTHNIVLPNGDYYNLTWNILKTKK
jgi:t-SNARE complex subunit (syntaxin)